MNTLQSGVLTLVRSAITQQAYNLPEGFHIDEAMSIIYRHNIQPLCYVGAILCGIPNSSAAMQKLFHSYCSAVVVASRQDSSVKRILAAFDENQIDYIPLKGVRMRPLYPNPELRTMGDADILIRAEQYGRIIPILKNQSYFHHRDNDWHYIWFSRDLNLELHHRLFSGQDRTFNVIYGSGWESALLNEDSRWELTPEDELLYMLEHLAKHYIKGVGIRQVADLWVFLRNHPSLDDAYIQKKLIALNRVRFYKNILHLLDVWFNDNIPDEMSTYLTEYIFTNGCWGTEENRALGNLVRTTNNKNTTNKQFVSKFFKFLFPDRKTLALTFPSAIRYRALYIPLLLICPIYRLCNERGILKKWIHTALAHNPEKVNNKQKELEYVGLGNLH